MKYLFTAPRFHTNQVPIVKGLVEKGHEVRYFVVFIGATEDHSVCEPLVLKPSHTTKLEKKKLAKTKSDSEIESAISGHFIPDFMFLRQVFEEYMPDIVICREKTSLTLCVKFLCDEHRIPCILYDQEPLYPLRSALGSNTVTPNKPALLSRLKTKMERTFNPDLRRVFKYRDSIGFPKARMTPVLYRRMPRNLSEKKPTSMSSFVPFVAERIQAAEDRVYCQNGIVHILSVGKYRDYKNLPILVEAGAMLKKSCNFAWQMTIIGQVSNSDEEDYFRDMQQRINNAGLKDKIRLKKNVSYENMTEEYLQNDLFILSSKKETASISILEAMAHGLAVISTDYNGTASYIEEGITGYTFATENVTSLVEKIETSLSVGIESLGRKAKEIAIQKYTWKSVCELYSYEYWKQKLMLE